MCSEASEQGQRILILTQVCIRCQEKSLDQAKEKPLRKQTRTKLPVCCPAWRRDVANL